MNRLAKEIVGKLFDWGFNGRNTLIFASADLGEVDGSISGLNFLKNKLNIDLGWSERNIHPTLDDGFNFLKNDQKIDTNIVIFDDFIGSGKTMVKKINKLKKLISDSDLSVKSINVISYIAMNSGVDHVDQNTDVIVYCPLILKKGITDYENNSVALEKIKIAKDMESKLQAKCLNLKLKDFTLGFGESESLYQVYGHNCSNNIFPVFWWPRVTGGKARNTLFKRSR